MQQNHAAVEEEIKIWMTQCMGHAVPYPPREMSNNEARYEYELRELWRKIEEERHERERAEDEQMIKETIAPLLESGSIPTDVVYFCISPFLLNYPPLPFSAEMLLSSSLRSPIQIFGEALYPRGANVHSNSIPFLLSALFSPVHIQTVDRDWISELD